ncbi:MAG: hypothetical protein ACE5J5_01470 [Candidatus Hydrothermarchaeales archaeon]
MTNELVAWIGCQNCQETMRMSYMRWSENLKKGVCPAGNDLSLAQCAKTLSKVIFG